MEQRLELEFVRGGFLHGPRDLGFRTANGSRQDGRDGIRRGRDGAREGFFRARVDDVDVGREFVLGEGDDVRQMERVREDGGDFGCGVEGKADRDAFGSVHDDAFEGLREALAWGWVRGQRMYAPSCGFARNRAGLAWRGTGATRRRPWAVGQRWAGGGWNGEQQLTKGQSKARSTESISHCP